MHLDIKLEQTKDMFCFESALASVAVWWKRRYEMIFSQSWNFDFKWRKAVADCELIINRGDMTGLLKQYHGISSFYHLSASSSDALSIIENELSSFRPVYTEIASSSVPWLPQNEKSMNFDLPLIILGLEDSNTIVCLEIHSLKKTAFLPVTSFIQGFRTLNTFMITEEENLKFDWRSAVSDVIEQFSNSDSNPIYKMMLMADFLESDAFNDILPAYAETQAFGSIPVLKRTFRIGPSRMIFATAIKYMAQACNCNELLEVYGKLVYLSGQWYNIRSVLTKEFYTGKLEREALHRVAEKVRETANLEENAAKILTSLYMNKTSKSIRSITLKKEALQQVNENDSLMQGETIFIDIRQYCNNKAFSDNEENTSNANLTGLGEFFLTKDLPTEQIWNIDQMRFKFIDTVFSECDNISCRGQVIPVPSSCYTAVMLLGCSEWGSNKESMEILQDSKVMDSFTVEFADWFTESPPANQHLAWSGTSFDNSANADKCRSRYLYAEICPLKKGSYMDSILLPNCPNIHLFAISLIK